MALRVLIATFLLCLLLVQPALAQGEPESLEDLIASFYSGAVRIVGLAAFLMLLYAGAVRMLPFGNPKQSNEIIQDVVIGTVLLLSAVIILNAINPDLTEQERPIMERLLDLRPEQGAGG